MFQFKDISLNYSLLSLPQASSLVARVQVKNYAEEATL